MPLKNGLFLLKEEVAGGRDWCLIVHGLGEHCGRYEKISKRLLSSNFNLLRFDLRGHGRSEGKRGDIRTFDDYLDDIEKATDGIKKFHLIGHSLGGLIVIYYAMKRPERLRSLVASAPLLGLKINPPKFKLLLGRVLYRIAPGVSMSNEIDPNKLSHDKSVVEAYINDPLVHRKITVRWFFETMKAMDFVNRHPERIRTPALFLHGSSDELTDPKATESFYKKVNAEKKLCIYEGFYHEPFNELNNEQVFEEVIGWLKKFS